VDAALVLRRAFGFVSSALELLVGIGNPDFHYGVDAPAWAKTAKESARRVREYRTEQAARLCGQAMQLMPNRYAAEPQLVKRISKP
jgi:hypothetical protein